MKEAHVVCVCPSYKINDLNKFLLRGQSFTILEGEAVRSADLKRAEKIGAVTIRWAERCRVVKQPDNAPPYLRKLKKPEPQPADPAPIQYVRVDELRDVLMQAFAEFRVELLAELRGMVIQGQAAGTQSVRPGSSNATKEPLAESPVFIPSKIVDKTRAVGLSTTKKEETSTGVDKAVGALKASRK